MAAQDFLDADDVADAGLSEAGSAEDQGALLSRLELIEERPLVERPAAYAQLHDELAAVLEGRQLN